MIYEERPEIYDDGDMVCGVVRSRPSTREETCDHERSVGPGEFIDVAWCPECQQYLDPAELPAQMTGETDEF